MTLAIICQPAAPLVLGAVQIVMLVMLQPAQLVPLTMFLLEMITLAYFPATQLIVLLALPDHKQIVTPAALAIICQLVPPLVLLAEPIVMLVILQPVQLV